MQSLISLRLTGTRLTYFLSFLHDCFSCNLFGDQLPRQANNDTVFVLFLIYSDFFFFFFVYSFNVAAVYSVKFNTINIILLCFDIIVFALNLPFMITLE